MFCDSTNIIIARILLEIQKNKKNTMTTLRLITSALVVIIFAQSGFAPTNDEYRNKCLASLSTNEFFDPDDGKAKSNIKTAYLKYTTRIILKKYNEYEMTNAMRLQMALIVEYYTIMYDKQPEISLSNAYKASEFCHKKAIEEYNSLDARLKGSNTTYLDLAERCKDILKSTGIFDSNTALAEEGYEMNYFNLTENYLDYEGLTGIPLNDSSVDEDIENLKLKSIIEDNANHDQGTNMKRPITINPLFEIDENNRKILNRHTKQERHDLNIYIKMFLRPYFYLFLQAIEAYNEVKCLFVSVLAYCSGKGIHTVKEVEKGNAETKDESQEYTDSDEDLSV